MEDEKDFAAEAADWVDEIQAQEDFE